MDTSNSQPKYTSQPIPTIMLRAGNAYLNATQQASTSNGTGRNDNQEPADNAVQMIEEDDLVDEEEEEQDEYDVEAIRARRKNPKTGLFEYLVKWENYPESQNTWEPIDNLKCPDLIAAFNEQEKNKRKRNSTAGPSSQKLQEPSEVEKKRTKKSDSDNGNNKADGSSRRKGRTSKQDGDEDEDENILMEEDVADTSSTTGSNDTRDLNEQAIQRVKGFDRNLPVERIVGSCTDERDQVFFFIKWKDLERLELVELKEVEQKAPHELLSWYRERLYYVINNPAIDNEEAASKTINELPAATNA